uniref:Endonuclease/exonuclease/phosphatase domain-containing protein n=1 Tax=Ananas comosus var. bracteatus TaxID=296719 RepID=A0A6V7PLE1_ANACO|nr:unnamed protein product [Ananas comosus var. bracteatus]
MGWFILTQLATQRKVDGKVFLISNIYGPTSVDLKADFFHELQTICDRAGDRWTALGDFNVMLSVQDKNGAPTNVSEILQFREVINEIGLIDLPLLNRTYTWSNGRRNPTLERLDRALISQGCHYSFPTSTLRALPRPRSDHTPLVLSSYTFLPSSNLFRFESFWLRYPSFKEVVASSWNRSVFDPEPSKCFKLKINQVTETIKSWSAGLYSTIKA